MSAKYLALLIYFVLSKTTGRVETTSNEYHLPGDVIPSSYKLKIIPDFEHSAFRGTVWVYFRIKYATNRVELHFKNLKTDSTEIDLDFDDGLGKLLHEDDILTMETTHPMVTDGAYYLTFNFEGSMKNTEKGLHKVSYKDSGEKKWMAATHLHGTYAREVFPCFDEPRYRTDFKISIARHPHQKTMARYLYRAAKCDIPDNEDDAKYIWDCYETSKPIPTHLVSIAVSELYSISNANNLVTLWIRHDLKDYSAYALKQSENALLQIEKYIGIPHQLPKLDIVAVPEIDDELLDNRRLTMLTEIHVLIEEHTSSQWHKTVITSSLCHQIARHWVGGLVTPENWDYSWLTDALAGYMGIFITPLVEPTVRIDQTFNVEILQPAFWMEIPHQRSLTRYQKTSSDINDEFDSTDYYKGTSLLRMLEHITSKNSLRSVINKYITDGQEIYSGLVTPQILYEALEHQARIDSFPLPPHVSITQVMKTWTENFGYPLLTVTKDSKTNIAKIQQSTYESSRAFKSLPHQNWIIPISYTTKSKAQFSNTKPSLWSISDKIVSIPGTMSETEWIICNLQQTGYYRVNYDFHNWHLLIKQLNENPARIHHLNRAQLIDDSFSLAFDEKLSYRIPLQLAEYLPQETDILPLLSAIFHFNILIKKYQHTRTCLFVHKYIKGLLENHIQNLSFEVKDTDSYATRMGKPTILKFACKIGLRVCIQKALSEYEKKSNDIDEIQPDFKEVIFCTALRNGENSQDVYDKLWDRFERSKVPYDRMIILKALGCTHDVELIRRTLNALIEPKNGKMTILDKKHAYNSILSSSIGFTTVLKFIKDQIPTISTLDDDAISLLKAISNQFEHKVNSEIHVIQLKRLKTQLTKLDSQKYADLIQSFHLACSAGIERINENNRKSRNLVPIFMNTHNIETPTAPHSSFAAAFIPSSTFLFLFTAVLLLYYLHL